MKFREILKKERGRAILNIVCIIVCIIFGIVQITFSVIMLVKTTETLTYTMYSVGGLSLIMLGIFNFINISRTSEGKKPL